MSQTKSQLIEGSAASELTAAKTLLGAGSAGAPSLTATGDTNTGIFFPTADTIAFAEGGVETVRIDSSGRVGIGTTPSATLHVAPSSGSANFQISRGSKGLQINQDSDSADPNINTIGTTALKFLRDGSESMRIDTSGRLLIGTSTSEGNMAVAPQVQLEGTTVDGSTSAIKCNGGTTATNGSRLYLNRSRGTALTSRTVVAAGDTLGTIFFGGADGANIQPAASIAGFVDDTPGAGDMPGRIVLATTADGASSPTERMRITSNTNTTIRFGDENYLRSINLDFHGQALSGGIPSAKIQCLSTGTGDWQSHLLFFIYDGTGGGGGSTLEAMRINAGRELLVGYTSDNGNYKLQVNSQIFATSSTVATSDGRYKENVATLGGCVDLVKALRPVSFTWKPQQDITRTDDEGNEVLVREGHNFPDGTQVGFIAQEVQEVLAEKPWLTSVIKQNVRPAVSDSDGNELAPEEEFLGIAEGNLIAVLTSALQEAIGEIESLKARVVALESA
jgi:hypothetical protein